MLPSAWMRADGLWHRRVRLQGGPVWGISAPRDVLAADCREMRDPAGVVARVVDAVVKRWHRQPGGAEPVSRLQKKRAAVLTRGSLNYRFVTSVNEEKVPHSLTRTPPAMGQV
jgi:hypothetical protein